MALSDITSTHNSTKLIGIDKYRQILDRTSPQHAPAAHFGQLNRKIVLSQSFKTLKICNQSFQVFVLQIYRCHSSRAFSHGLPARCTAFQFRALPTTSAVPVKYA